MELFSKNANCTLLSVTGRQVVNIAHAAPRALPSNFLFSRECAIALHIKMHWPMSILVLHTSCRMLCSCGMRRTEQRNLCIPPPCKWTVNENAKSLFIWTADELQLVLPAIKLFYLINCLHQTWKLYFYNCNLVLCWNSAKICLIIKFIIKLHNKHFYFLFFFNHQGYFL